MSLKNPVTPPGIDPGTIRVVAQRLNLYATPGPSLNISANRIKLDLEGQYNFVNSMGSHSVRTH
jgi:hypothetical protein